jgi:UDP-glucuronate 4-epimerase
MKVLVTGAAGFLGMHISARLARAGYAVTGIDNLNPYYDPALKKARLDRLAAVPGFSFRRMDICDTAEINALFAEGGFDRVLHLAAQAGVRYSLENPMAYVDSNVRGFLNVLEACRRNQTAHLVYASSSSVYGANEHMPFGETDRVDTPVSLYAATKRADELMAHSYSHLFGLRTTGLRFFTVYGPWGRPDMALFLFTRAISRGEPLRLFNGGDMARDFTFVDDVAEAVTRLLQADPGSLPPQPAPVSAQAAPHYRIYNVAHGEPVRLSDFLEAIEAATGRKAIIEAAPMQPGDVRATYGDTQLLHKAIGYVPTTAVDEGVRRFVEWYVKHYAGAPVAGSAAL